MTRKGFYTLTSGFCSLNSARRPAVMSKNPPLFMINGTQMQFTWKELVQPVTSLQSKHASKSWHLPNMCTWLDMAMLVPRKGRTVRTRVCARAHARKCGWWGEGPRQELHFTWHGKGLQRQEEAPHCLGVLGQGKPPPSNSMQKSNQRCPWFKL